jgi:undecaprenyl-diphosphatase
VSELFPISSLGHSVLIPALVGGRWSQDLSVSAPESPYLAFIVGMHVATAVAMIIYFRRDWIRIISAFFGSLRYRQIATPDQKLAWMLVLATIPVGIAGLALEHLFRVVFSKPLPTAFFLAVNGLVLLAGERRRRSASARYAPARYPDVPMAVVEQREIAGREADSIAADRRLATMGFTNAVVIGAAQVFGLLPGISRDGIVTVTGMFRGLNREDAIRYSFLLMAPVILAAGALKIPDLTGPLGDGVRGQILAGSLLSGVGAYFSVRFLVRYFSSARSLTPFAIYCLIAGIASFAYLAIR